MSSEIVSNSIHFHPSIVVVFFLTISCSLTQNEANVINAFSKHDVWHAGRTEMERSWGHVGVERRVNIALL